MVSQLDSHTKISILILTLYHITLSSRWPVDLNVMGEAIQLLECEVGLPQRLSKNKQTNKTKNKKTHTALTLKGKMLNWTKLKCKTSAHQKTHFRT